MFQTYTIIKIFNHISILLWYDCLLFDFIYKLLVKKLLNYNLIIMQVFYWNFFIFENFNLFWVNLVFIYNSYLNFNFLKNFFFLLFFFSFFF